MSGNSDNQLDSFFPETVRSALLNSSEGELPDLRADEYDILPHNASPKRRRQFAAGRAAAHRALKRLDVSDFNPVLRGTDREPIWPAGVTGSIAHSADLAIAVASLSRDWRSLGVDIESLAALSKADISSKICRPEELESLAADEETRKLQVLEIFCAKESVFKALFPVYRVYFGFKDALLSWDKSRQSFDAVVLKSLDPAGGAVPRLNVNVLHTTSYLLTFTALAHQSGYAEPVL